MGKEIFINRGAAKWVPTSVIIKFRVKCSLDMNESQYSLSDSELFH